VYWRIDHDDPNMSMKPALVAVLFRASESDKYVVEFKFLKARSGWYLVEVRDSSL
jgi:hypothetical protein